MALTGMGSLYGTGEPYPVLTWNRPTALKRCSEKMSSGENQGWDS